MQVGLLYHNFGTLSGTTQFDDFTMATTDLRRCPCLVLRYFPPASISRFTEATSQQVLINNTTPNGGQCNGL